MQEKGYSMQEKHRANQKITRIKKENRENTKKENQTADQLQKREN